MHELNDLPCAVAGRMTVLIIVASQVTQIWVNSSVFNDDLHRFICPQTDNVAVQQISGYRAEIKLPLCLLILLHNVTGLNQEVQS